MKIKLTSRLWSYLLGCNLARFPIHSIDRTLSVSVTRYLVLGHFPVTPFIRLTEPSLCLNLNCSAFHQTPSSLYHQKRLVSSESNLTVII